MENEKTSGTNEQAVDQGPVDPWLAAFAALEPKSEEATETGAADEAGADDGKPDSDADGADGQDASGTDDGHSTPDPNPDGGLGGPAGQDSREGGEGQGSLFETDEQVTEDSIKEYEENLGKEMRERAINEIAAEFVKRGIRNRDGVLGATMDDADICKRDADGVPRFYNPETGREFTGDNPRRQAQEWVDDYNKELARVFDDACAQYEQKLMETVQPQIEVMKFAPKYNELDAIRRGMFDNVIQDYEVKDDDGKVVGYSCDLDKALAMVERQVAVIQEYAKSHMPQEQAVQPQQPQTPALDIKASGGTQGQDKAPTSLAEAMEQLQDAQLSSLKG